MDSFVCEWQYRWVSYDAIYLHSFGVEHISKEIQKFIGSEKLITNIYRMQAYDSKMCGYFCIEFIDFMLKGKMFLECTNFLSPNVYEKNHEKYFQ